MQQYFQLQLRKIHIGAGSVVTKKCDKNSVYIGNPAKKNDILN